MFGQPAGACLQGLVNGCGGEAITARPIPCDVEEDQGQVRTDGRSDDRGGQRQGPVCGVEAEPRTYERASECRHEPSGPGLSGPVATHPGPVRPQADRHAHGDDRKQSIVQRDRRPERHHHQGAEEPAAQAWNERIDRPQHYACRASEAAPPACPARQPEERERREAREADHGAGDALGEPRLRDRWREVDLRRPVARLVNLAALEEVVDQPAAGSRLINHFFESGQVDESRYRPAEVDFTPAITQTGLAKGIAGTMVGFAGLAALSLLWLARRAGRWGGFGRTTSVVLRSIYPLVPGLGGWFLGALVVMTFWPAIPLDNGLLAVVSVGVPIGLGTYWAWVRRDWPAQARTAGLVAALGGALISAWLGLNAADGPLALATTIVGATVGANLALIFLDIARDRPGRDRFAATAVDEALKTRPSRLAEH